MTNQAFATAPTRELGQLFIISLEKSYSEADLAQLIKAYCPGGFVLFKKNLPTLLAAKKINRSLNEYSQKYCRSKPLIALDQEGGTVSRLPLDFQMPSAMAIGLSGDASMAYEYGQLVGRQLKELGFNVNFAPVLDVSSGEAGDFINTRAFASEPGMVTAMGVAYSKGLLAEGIVPTAKHFPGIGDARADLHKTTATNNETWKNLLSTRLMPFHEFIKLGGSTLIMTSHLSFPELDKTGMPSGFSRIITNDLLKDFMGFKGLVITDDLEMNGANVFDNQQNGLVKAFYAGTDMLVFSKFSDKQKLVFKNFRQSFESKVLDTSVLNDRIVKIKSFKDQIPAGSSRKLASQEDLRDDFNIFNQKLIKNILTKQVPLLPRGIKKIFVVSDENTFSKYFAEEYAGDLLQIKFDEVEKYKNKLISGKGTAIFVPVYKNSDFKKALAIPKVVSRNTTIINFMGPLNLKKSEKFSSVVNLHFNEKKAGLELARIINEFDN